MEAQGLGCSVVTRWVPQLPSSTLQSLRRGRGTGLSWEGATVRGDVEVFMRFHPVGGEDVSVVSKDFDGEREALEAIAKALDERRSLALKRARYDREDRETGVVINLANVVSVRVSRSDSAETGQYL